MNTKVWYLSLLLASGSASAQKALTPDVLKTLSSSYEGTAADKALRNAISANSLKTLALNQENTAAPDTWFSTSVNSSGITDQKSSGRCWLFTGTNVIRARVGEQLGMPNFQFSHVYLFFYDQLEKSNLFLQGIIDTRKSPMDDKTVEWLFRNPLSDGGQYTGISDLVMKYGLVPREVMAETHNSNNTSEFNTLLKRKLREFGITLREESENGASERTLEQHKVEMMKTVYRMLVLAYGEPPATFSWAPTKNGKAMTEPKSYTPMSFYKEVCGGEDLYANYVMLMNDPTRPYNKVYEIDYDRHTYDGHNWLYLNLPIEDIKQAAIASLKDSTMMYFSCDVGKHLNSKNGMLDLKSYDYGSLFNTSFGMNKKQRIQTFDSGSSHAMTLMAVDLDAEGQPKKWKVENSWGPSYGHNGFLIMTDEWFNEYMFRLVVNKKYCTADMLKLLKEKPVRLPAWDPMFSNEQ
ncbi:MAG: C1 family peptidase [Clostridium sp.]|nr:C1 family peptidase [Clostridium sp.]